VTFNEWGLRVEQLHLFTRHCLVRYRILGANTLKKRFFLSNLRCIFDRVPDREGVGQLPGPPRRGFRNFVQSHAIVQKRTDRPSKPRLQHASADGAFSSARIIPFERDVEALGQEIRELLIQILRNPRQFHVSKRRRELVYHWAIEQRH